MNFWSRRKINATVTDEKSSSEGRFSYRSVRGTALGFWILISILFSGRQVSDTWARVIRWEGVSYPVVPTSVLVIDPTNPQVQYVGTTGGVYKRALVQFANRRRAGIFGGTAQAASTASQICGIRN
jgi:hypothetical protein